eukprot:1710536-Rhodomonas_salina.2
MQLPTVLGRFDDTDRGLRGIVQFESWKDHLAKLLKRLEEQHEVRTGSGRVVWWLGSPASLFSLVHIGVFVSAKEHLIWVSRVTRWTTLGKDTSQPLRCARADDAGDVEELVEQSRVSVDLLMLSTRNRRNQVQPACLHSRNAVPGTNVDRTCYLRFAMPGTEVFYCATSTIVAAADLSVWSRRHSSSAMRDAD